MPTTISTSLIPPGGWRFNEGHIVLRAVTFDKLVQLLESHRASNGLPAGNPRQDVMDQIVERNPTSRLGQYPPNHFHPTLLDKVKAFASALANFLASGGKLEEQNTANIRSEICSKCHNNQPVAGVASGSCTSCNKLAENGVIFARTAILHGRRASHESNLKACALCGCDLKLKIWFPIKYFDPDGSQKNKYPSFCWVKGE